jgi:acyl-CoA thioesterase I
MKTQFEMTRDRQERLLRIARETPCTNDIRPARFMRLMETNTGVVSVLSRFGLDEHGLERKNPVIVAFGDSVTAGHFELLFDFTDMPGLIAKVQSGELLEIVDVAAVYHEQFRLRLTEKYPATSPSVINAGIAGDSIMGMHRRVYRDVIRYQPDLVIINGTLNWGDGVGTLDAFTRLQRSVVQAIQANTDANIVLLTPNPMSDILPDNGLDARVQVVRELADETQVSLVDAYRLWGLFTTDRAELRECLANHINHPTAVGHRVYALALMQLFVGD